MILNRRSIAPRWATWQLRRGSTPMVPTAAMMLGVPSDPVEIPYTWISPRLTRRPTTAITKAQISQTGGATATASASSTTVSQYGINTATAQLDTAVDADPANLAAFLTTWESTPRPRQPIVRLILLKRTDDECLKVLNVAPGTRVRITGAPATWPAGAVTFVVEGIRHEITNDFRAVDWMTSAPVGTTYLGGLLLPGVAGNYASTPDDASLDITGDIDLRAEVTLANWNTGVFQTIVAKYVAAGNQKSYGLGVNSSGLLFLFWSNNGSADLDAASTATPDPNDAGRLAIRATLDVNNGAAGNTAVFYTAPSINGPWTQLGTSVTAGGTTSIFSSTSAVEVGSDEAGTLDLPAATVHAVEIRDGIDGTAVANPVFSAQTVGTTSFTDDAGRTWTLNGTAQIAATSVVPGPWFRWDESYWNSTVDVRPF